MKTAYLRFAHFAKCFAGRFPLETFRLIWTVPVCSICLRCCPLKPMQKTCPKKPRRLTTETIMPIYKSLKQYKLRIFCVLSS